MKKNWEVYHATGITGHDSAGFNTSQQNTLYVNQRRDNSVLFLFSMSASISNFIV